MRKLPAVIEHASFAGRPKNDDPPHSIVQKRRESLRLNRSSPNQPPQNCPTGFGAPANTTVCPACAVPSPVLSREAVEARTRYYPSPLIASARLRSRITPDKSPI